MFCYIKPFKLRILKEFTYLGVYSITVGTVE